MTLSACPSAPCQLRAEALEGLDQPGAAIACPASTPLADWRQSSWPVSGSDRPPVVAGDNRGAMTLEATRKLSHPTGRAIASTGFLCSTPGDNHVGLWAAEISAEPPPQPRRGAHEPADPAVRRQRGAHHRGLVPSAPGCRRTTISRAVLRFSTAAPAVCCRCAGWPGRGGGFRR
jgi:hypothetical protein